MHVHFIIHEAFEAPGAYEIWARQQGHEVTYSRVYLNEPLPKAVDSIDLLIVMGGPQDPTTSKTQCPHFDSQAEQSVILAAIKAKKIVIGVCLGAQLIGQALGATFEHSPEKEIGKFPIKLTVLGQENPWLNHFGMNLAVGHWHNDMPGLTPDAKILAYSEGCPRQIISYSDWVYGFQCHLEFTPEVVEMLIANSENDLSQTNKFRFVETITALRSHDYSEMNQKLYVFLDKISQAYLAHGN